MGLFPSKCHLSRDDIRAKTGLTTSHRDAEYAGFKHTFPLLVNTGKLLSAQRKHKLPCFARLQVETLKGFEVVFGDGGRRFNIGDVKLRHFIARAVAHIADGHTDRDDVIG
jgi:hypothetical protein